MQSKILANKKIVKKGNSEAFVDLTTRSMDYTSRIDVIDAFYVGDDMTMRVDLISYAAYGNVDNFDIICKYNSISNPYALDALDLILVPDLSSMHQAMTNPQNDNSAEDVRNQYIDATKTSKLDPKKIQYDEEMKNIRKQIVGGNFSKYNLPPNLATPGSSEGTVNSDGTVSLGADVTKKR